MDLQVTHEHDRRLVQPRLPRARARARAKARARARSRARARARARAKLARLGVGPDLA